MTSHNPGRHVLRWLDRLSGSAICHGLAQTIHIYEREDEKNNDGAEDDTKLLCCGKTLPTNAAVSAPQNGDECRHCCRSQVCSAKDYVVVCKSPRG